jgi:hypothetical protein
VRDDLVDRPGGQQRAALARVPDGSLPRRGGALGGSALGGCEEFLDERPSWRSSDAIRSS